MLAPSELKKVRSCGRLETYSTARHHLGIYNNVGFTATYHSPGAASHPFEQNIFTALRHVIAEHPSLSVIPLNEDKSYPNVCFAQLHEIDLRACVEFRQRKTLLPKDGEVDEELDELLAIHHTRNFNGETQPFWRLLVLDSIAGENAFTASWFFHHALADGTSAILFHETFLAALNRPSDGNADPVIKPSVAALLPPLEELHPMTISWGFFLQAILGAILPSVFNKRPAKLWTGKPVPSTLSSLPGPMYRTLVCSARTTRKLAQISRKEHTSVTSTLQCLLAASLFLSLPVAEVERVKIEGPISMRRFLGIKKGQMTSAIAQYEYLHERPTLGSADQIAKTGVLQHFSWNEARAVKSAIQAEIGKEGCDNPIALLQYVSDMPKFFMEKLGKPRHPSVELSNIGVWHDEPDSNANWTIGRMLFSQSPNVTGSAFAVNVVTGGDGNAVVNFCWSEGAVEQETMNSIIRGIRRGLDGLTNATES